MIHNLSEIITNFLVSKKVKNENESEIYISVCKWWYYSIIVLTSQNQ